MFDGQDDVGGATGRARALLGTLRNELTAQTDAWLNRGVRPSEPIVVDLRKHAERGDGQVVNRHCRAILDVADERWLFDEAPLDEELTPEPVESAAEVLRLLGVRVEAGFVLPAEFEAPPPPLSKTLPWETKHWSSCWQRTMVQLAKNRERTPEWVDGWIEETSATIAEHFEDIWFDPNPPDTCTCYKHQVDDGFVFTVIARWGQTFRALQVPPSWYLKEEG